MAAEGVKSAPELCMLMEDALSACSQLYDYTLANFSVFSGSNDKKIMEVIDRRMELVDTLLKLEKKIDNFLPEDKSPLEAQTELPCEVEKFRRKARSILDQVTEMDLKAMNLISQKMQKYKDETLKCRNKKKLSAYIKASAMISRSPHYDCEK